MYFTNSERNRIIYEFWEKNLTVDEVSSRTGIPRSTVGYYFRKFNKLAAKGKPAVFPGPSEGVRKQGSHTEDSLSTPLLRVRILTLMKLGNWEELYYRLSVLKLLKELGFLTAEHRDKFLIFLGNGEILSRSESTIDLNNRKPMV